MNKKQLAKRVSKRLGNAVPQTVVQDAITIICQELSSKLEAGESVYIEHFGVLDVFEKAGHPAKSIGTGKDIFVEGQTTVRFIPHETLKMFLDQRIDKFKKEK